MSCYYTGRSTKFLSNLFNTTPRSFFFTSNMYHCYNTTSLTRSCLKGEGAFLLEFQCWDQSDQEKQTIYFGKSYVRKCASCTLEKSNILHTQVLFPLSSGQVGVLQCRWQCQRQNWPENDRRCREVRAPQTWLHTHRTHIRKHRYTRIVLFFFFFFFFTQITSDYTCSVSNHKQNSNQMVRPVTIRSYLSRLKVDLFYQCAFGCA